MNRREFLKGVCGVLAAVVLPLPKIAIKAVKIPLNGCLTLIQLARRRPKAELSKIAEVLNETNEIIADACWEQVGLNKG